MQVIVRTGRATQGSMAQCLSEPEVAQYALSVALRWRSRLRFRPVVNDSQQDHCPAENDLDPSVAVEPTGEENSAKGGLRDGQTSTCRPTNNVSFVPLRGFCSLSRESVRVSVPKARLWEINQP